MKLFATFFQLIAIIPATIVAVFNSSSNEQCVHIVLTSKIDYKTICNQCIKEMINNNYYVIGGICNFQFELKRDNVSSYDCCLV